MSHVTCHSVSKFKQKFLRLFARADHREPDWLLVALVGALVLFGLLMLVSASGGYAYYRYQDGYYFLKHQAAALLLGLAACWFLSRFDYHQLRKWSFLMLLVSVVLLILVFIPGLASAANFKARSWINIFGFSLQPSELVKLTFLVYLAGWIESRKGKQLENVAEGLGPFLIVLGVIGALMLAQPDFGTLSIITAVSLIAYFVGGGKLAHIFLTVAIGAVGLFLMVKAMPYQADRFRCVIEPAYSASKACYQVNQSLIAIGSGGLWGRGFTASRQKLMYLPEVSGDSIFAVIGEELGFVFTALLVLAFLAFFWRGLRIAKNAPDNFGRVLAVGITSWLTIQALVNIGGMSNFIPMTGVPLPFVSFGGSAVLAALAAVGVLVNISRQTRSRNA